MSRSLPQTKPRQIRYQTDDMATVEKRIQAGEYRRVNVRNFSDYMRRLLALAAAKEIDIK